MDYHEHKKYFETAYNTGSDMWTRMAISSRGSKLIEKLPKDGLVLDVGSGRGLFSKFLVESGFRVIGIDFEPNIVNKTNAEIKNWGMEGRLKFMEASALDIPFADASFDGVCDFGLMENLYKDDWATYAEEIARVLKPGGFYLNVSLSRKTKNFFEFSPTNSADGEFEKYNVHYHFFTQEEMREIFAGKLTALSQEEKYIEKPADLYLLETLFQK